MNIHETLIETIKESTSVLFEDIEITEETDVIDDLHFDSISLMYLILEIENRFEIEFDDDLSYENISTISKLESYVKSKIGMI